MIYSPTSEGLQRVKPKGTPKGSGNSWQFIMSQVINITVRITYLTILIIINPSTVQSIQQYIHTQLEVILKV